jgi:hypothetical protein
MLGDNAASASRSPEPRTQSPGSCPPSCILGVMQPCRQRRCGWRSAQSRPVLLRRNDTSYGLSDALAYLPTSIITVNGGAGEQTGCHPPRTTPAFYRGLLQHRRLLSPSPPVLHSPWQHPLEEAPRTSRGGGERKASSHCCRSAGTVAFTNAFTQGLHPSNRHPPVSPGAVSGKGRSRKSTEEGNNKKSNCVPLGIGVQLIVSPSSRFQDQSRRRAKFPHRDCRHCGRLFLIYRDRPDDRCQPAPEREPGSSIPRAEKGSDDPLLRDIKPRDLPDFPPIAGAFTTGCGLSLGLNL